MKTISKILSIVLVLSMVLGFALVGQAAETALATFKFPASGSTGSWQDGGEMASNTTFTDGSYTLKFTNCSKVYSKGNDANGKGFIKFGTSKVVGKLTFTVPDDVTRVELHLAKYKKSGNAGYYSINNGTGVALTKVAQETKGTASQWDVVSVDTSTNKTVTVATTSKGYRMVMFSVIYYGTTSGDVCEHTYDNCEDTTCNKGCGHTRTAVAHVYDSCEDTTCANCTLTRQPVEHKYTNEYDATCNNSNCTKTRTVTLPAANSELDFATATKVGAAQDHNTYTSNKYYVTGTVKTVGNTTYGNITLEDENGNTFYIHTVKDIDGNNYGYFTGKKPVVGDKIKVYGPIGSYNNKPQMTPAVVQPVVENCEHEYTNDFDETCNKCGEPRTVTLPAADSTLTFDVAEKLGLAQTTGMYTTNKYYVEGTITKITSEEFGNMEIKDAAGKTFVIYGSYNSTGEKRYDAMENAPKVGDKVKFYGVIGQYDGTAQMKNAWIMSENTNQGGNTGSNTGSNNQNNNNSQTGDVMSIASVISTMVLSMSGVVALVIKKKSF